MPGLSCTNPPPSPGSDVGQTGQPLGGEGWPVPAVRKSQVRAAELCLSTGAGRRRE